MFRTGYCAWVQGKDSVCRFCGRPKDESFVRTCTNKTIGITEQTANFAKASKEYILAGSPQVSDEVVAERFAICEPCPLFRKIEEGKGTCIHANCGCSLKGVGKESSWTPNKLRWGTEECPMGKWGKVLPQVKPAMTLKSETKTQMKVRSFVYGKSPIYSRCSKVLKHSINKHNPGIDFEIIHVKDLDKSITSLMGKGRTSHDTNNALKTKYQMELVQGMENGELLCLLDSDMMCTGNLSSIEELDFDLALTDKEGLQAKGPINSGVIFVRISDKTKEWFRRWYAEADYLLHNAKELRAEKAKFAGINQSALDRLMRQEHDLNIQLIPCRIWNSTVVTWPLFSEETKLVHILASLRNNIFYRASCNGHVSKLARIFRQYEKEIMTKGKYR